MARGDSTLSMKDAMQKLLKSYRLDRKFTETEIINSWARIMGKPIASRTKNVFFHQGKLYVKLTSAPLKHELQMSKTKVLDLLNKEFGESTVQEIIFQ